MARVKTNFNSKHLRALRREAGLTQEQLGEEISLSRETISAIENGHQEVKSATSLETIENWIRVCRSKSDKSKKTSIAVTLLQILFWQ